MSAYPSFDTSDQKTLLRNAASNAKSAQRELRALTPGITAHLRSFTTAQGQLAIFLLLAKSQSCAT